MCAVWDCFILQQPNLSSGKRFENSKQLSACHDSKSPGKPLLRGERSSRRWRERTENHVLVGSSGYTHTSYGEEEEEGERGDEFSNSCSDLQVARPFSDPLQMFPKVRGGRRRADIPLTTKQPRMPAEQLLVC